MPTSSTCSQYKYLRMRNSEKFSVINYTTRWQNRIKPSSRLISYRYPSRQLVYLNCGKSRQKRKGSSDFLHGKNQPQKSHLGSLFIVLKTNHISCSSKNYKVALSIWANRGKQTGKNLSPPRVERDSILWLWLWKDFLMKKTGILRRKSL